jgi:mRNA interferase MazF
MRKADTAPKRGDIVWVTLNPTRGHEQSGRRPALVVSARAYNARTGMALMVPLSTRGRGYSTEVAVTGATISGVALLSQVRSIDWRARSVETVDQCPQAALAEIQEILAGIIISE